MTVDTEAVRLHAPSVLKSPATLERQVIAGVVRLDTAYLETEVDLARATTTVFITPNQYVDPNFAIVMEQPVPLRFRYWWSRFFGLDKSHRTGKEPIDVILLAVKDPDAAQMAIEQAGFSVTGDLPGLVGRVIGIERDPALIAANRESDARSARRSAWKQGGWTLALGAFLLVRFGIEEDLSWIQVSVGVALMVGVYLVTVGVVASRRREPSRHTGSQQRQWVTIRGRQTGQWSLP